jgi:heme/copper-type cytochrome/quinol oxidase subunit 2
MTESNTEKQNPIRRWAWIGFVLAVLLILAAPVPAFAGPTTTHTFRLEASSFQYSPAVLQVKPGDRVTLEVAATDVVHGLYIDGYNLDVVADPGQTARLTFVADRPGSFRFRCSVTCGALHPFMIGKLNVGPDWLFWKAMAASLFTIAAGVFLSLKK